MTMNSQRKRRARIPQPEFANWIKNGIWNQKSRLPLEHGSSKDENIDYRASDVCGSAKSTHENRSAIVKINGEVFALSYLGASGFPRVSLLPR